MNKKALRILWDHNLPFILWSAAAGFEVLVPGPADGYLSCPVRFFLGWCPGCDLTGAYVGFIKTGRAPVWFGVIFGLFLVNLLISLLRARRSADAYAHKR